MGTFIIAVLLIIVIFCIIRYLIKQWKAGNGFCGGDCKHCGHCEGIREMDAAKESGGCSGNCAACKGCSNEV